jgi:beta-N-acetylhexosaminidase
MLYLYRIIESLTRIPFNQFLLQEFYYPIGLTTMGYLPIQRFSRERIVPTEYDRYFRNQLIHGYVHDPAAAMMGGVAGHAGVFSNARDVAAFMQMLLNGGEYNGNRFLSSEAVSYFTSSHFEGNRRGLGFDKPETDKSKNSPVPGKASISTFGHLGFTGTAAWADPENDLIFVILTNRVYPDQRNRTFNSEKVRTHTFKAVYDALYSGQEELQFGQK